MKYFMVTAVMVLAAAAAEYGTATVMEVTPEGTFPSGTSRPAFLSVTAPGTDEPEAELIWHYSIASGFTQKVCPMGDGAARVFAGGWYGGGLMFQGEGGDGTVLWQTEPQLGANEYWKNLATGTAAAWDDDVYYLVRKFDIWNDNGTPTNPGDDYLVSQDNLEVCLFSGAGPTPQWVWDGSGTLVSTGLDEPGKYYCTADGGYFAVGGTINGHLGLAVFVPDSASPCLLFEDAGFAYSPRQLRMTDDGSRVIFSVGAELVRVEVATGTIEATFNLGASTDCFDISADGSLVAFGFTAAKLAQWNGSQYTTAWSYPMSGYYAGAAAVSGDGQAVYYGFYKNTYLSNRILRFDVSGSTPLWTYDTPSGSGGYQDVVSWIDCSHDGGYLAVSSWGCQAGGGDEVIVLDDADPSSPVFSINTPGSMWHVDISPDGAYVSAAGKHVHANVMGSGTDIYMADATPLGIGSASPASALRLSLSPNPCAGSAAAGFSLPEAGAAELNIYDLTGRRVQHVAGGNFSGGTHSVEVSTDLPGGLYIVRLTFGGERLTEKLLISR